MTNKTKNFRAMTAQAERLSLPRSFQADLTEHDAKAVSDDREYLWVLYESGTHLIELKPWDGTKRPLVTRTVRTAADPGYFKGAHIFHVHKGSAVEMTLDAAIELAQIFDAFAA